MHLLVSEVEAVFMFLMVHSEHFLVISQSHVISEKAALWFRCDCPSRVHTALLWS